MEQITSYIMAYLPSITAILAVVATVMSFSKKVKSIVGDTSLTNNQLKKALNERDTGIQKALRETMAKIEKLEATVAETTKQNAELVKQNALLVAQNEKITALLDEVTTIKNQATAILESKGE